MSNLIFIITSHTRLEYRLRVLTFQFENGLRLRCPLSTPVAAGQGAQPGADSGRGVSVEEAPGSKGGGSVCERGMRKAGLTIVIERLHSLHVLNPPAPRICHLAERPEGCVDQDPLGEAPG